MKRIPRILILAALPALVVSSAAAQTEMGNEEWTWVWGGEIRLHAGAIEGEEAPGRTGAPLETRFSFERAFAPGLRIFGELGTGEESAVEGNGLHRLFAEYTLDSERGLKAEAGWIRVPFGRWDTLTVSRALIKDREFFQESGSLLQLRRSSAGLGFHAGPPCSRWTLRLSIAPPCRGSSSPPRRAGTWRAVSG